MAEVLLALRFALAALLYLFLGVALTILWLELRRHERNPSPAHHPGRLAVEEGPDADKSIPLRPVTTVGRAEDNVLMLDDPFASTNHAMVLWREGQWWLEDLESHNGTYLNGQRLDRPQRLTSGDHIRIGESILRFDLDEKVTT